MALIYHILCSRHFSWRSEGVEIIYVFIYTRTEALDRIAVPVKEDQDQGQAKKYLAIPGLTGLAEVANKFQIRSLERKN